MASGPFERFLNRNPYNHATTSFSAFLCGCLGGASFRPCGLRSRFIRGVSKPSGFSAIRPEFTLDYAPHFGMFRHHAGDDLLDQLRFMAEMGFRSMEDNGMSGRTPEMQEAIAQEMTRLNMRMGVFVAHRIDWQQANLASGDPARREEFLDDIRARRGSGEASQRYVDDGGARSDRPAPGNGIPDRACGGIAEARGGYSGAAWSGHGP